MNANATVRTSDLEAALDYLERHVEILDTLAQEQRGRDDSDELLTRLQALQGPGMNWEPLRYQGAWARGGSSSLATSRSFGDVFSGRIRKRLCDGVRGGTRYFRTRLALGGK
ncbi:hypothetical protein [Modestobacter sp. VKM Ac-2978]|uniref:hypothetical protein n=1 Tax=Modestobacter sp. VKM Ac-2978 TaxID=3004132 RepID=UPI0022AB3ED7|nr:hypothetical protein [Modestobacter sp. VKM Ac-2978]MCZ2848530.1 hypothetical protein [Modestobacter sp. VKM Ac-2978]